MAVSEHFHNNLVTENMKKRFLCNELIIEIHYILLANFGFIYLVHINFTHLWDR